MLGTNFNKGVCGAVYITLDTLGLCMKRLGLVISILLAIEIGNRVCVRWFGLGNRVY